MSFYDDASIVMIPSGYKVSKLYCQKPTDGTGDLAFTRTGSTATRVKSDGLIERCRTNQMLRSEELDNASWGKENIAVTANSVANPLNGLVNADKLTATVTGNSAPLLSQSVGSLSSQVATISGYFKKSEYNFLVIHAFGLAGTVFNLNTGVVVSGSGTITLVGDGWYRCAAVLNVTSTAIIYLTPSSAGAISGPTTAGSGIFAFGIQGEQGDIATDYIPTTSAAVTVGPIANFPRLDYTGGGCPKLLMEPTRTNVVLHAQQLDNAAWASGATSVTITRNAIVSPDGYQNADAVFTTVDNAQHNIRQTPGVNSVSGTTYVLSAYVKYNGYDYVRLAFTNAATGLGDFRFSTETLVVSGAQSVANSGKVDKLNNGWYRISFATIPTAVAGIQIQIASRADNNSGTFIGEVTKGFYAWGVQLEVGSFATSYIPTFNASVTRNNDAAVDTSISSLLGQTEGTLYWEGIVPPSNTEILVLEKSSPLCIARFRKVGTSTIAQLYIDSSGFNYNPGTILAVGSRVKLALGYKSGSLVFYANGNLINQSSSTFSNLSLDTLRLASDFGTPVVSENENNQFLIFKTRLSNSDLATLTTL